MTERTRRESRGGRRATASDCAFFPLCSLSLSPLPLPHAPQQRDPRPHWPAAPAIAARRRQGTARHRDRDSPDLSDARLGRLGARGRTGGKRRARGRKREGRRRALERAADALPAVSLFLAHATDSAPPPPHTPTNNQTKTAPTSASPPSRPASPRPPSPPCRPRWRRRRPSRRRCAT